MNNTHQDIIDYIISFLCYGDIDAAARLELSAPVDWTLRYPRMDVQNMVQASTEGKVLISPDAVYMSFFFLSRAEELLCPTRDEHGRFLAAFSILGEQNRLLIPLIDELSRLVLKALNTSLPSAMYSHIYLTHDIDTTDYYHHLRGAIGGICRGHWREVMASLRDIHSDPAYTFPWLMEQDRKVKDAEIIYFVKQTPGRGYDYPQYPLHRVPKMPVQYGLHSSYYGTLPKLSGTPVLHRSHYLRCSVNQMQRLTDAGVTDDFTMGFADKAGFRLQTTRAVRWINPQTMTLTNLTLHPLTIMDCTLSNGNYMNLEEDEAYFYAQEIFSKVRLYGGDITLLWHNSIINNETYHRNLYPKLLGLLR